MKKHAVLALFALPALALAADDAIVLSHESIRQRIALFEAKPSSQSTPGMSKYLWRGEPLWFIESPCCDHFNYLYNAQGQPVCAFSGGIAGAGDGACPAGITLFPSTAAATTP
ncbi:hypothetical protein RQP54_13700 [Curvibacter sp. APW13]|uniref:DUF6970 domain-containing protein n=1 Tax=Curvibacter sp. APW13 TaxID=3077236 RepID=UPI0028DE17F1|nr:hypothetical protein [Curvibacter sp. APW13]MDT8991921.1 hypothetical protein [Curvibacter sp. APW13]